MAKLALHILFSASTARAVEVAFKKPRFWGLKKQKTSPIFGFLGFSNSFLESHFNNHISSEVIELNNLNHIEFNHTLMTLFPQSISL